MNKSKLLISLLMAVSALLVAMPISSEDGYQVRHTIEFSMDDLSFEGLKGYDIVRLRDGDLLGAVGKPTLPFRQLKIALPAGMTAAQVRVVGTEKEEIPGAYRILPAQPPRPISFEARQRGFVGPDSETYGSPQAYPARWADLVGQTDLAGQNMAVLHVYPLRYFPTSSKLTFARSIQISIEGVPGHVCGDYLPRRLSERSRSSYERMLAGMVANPEDVELTVSFGPAPVSRGVGPGEFEYVIITHSSWVDDFQPLADWRIKKGIPSTIVTTDWIYTQGGYGGSDIEKIRAFIQDARDNWGAACFLLGGDTNIIPDHTRTITIPDPVGTDHVPNDTYFADYDEDWVCEVHVGRAPVRTSGHISTFINKLFTYEKDPPTTDYATMAALLGFDCAYCGSDDGEIYKENYVRAMHLPPGWTVNTEYESEPGTHEADVIAYLNQGHHLVNHYDHCSWYCMGVGWLCHEDYIEISDVGALTNGDRQSIVFAVGCNTCDITYTTCIGETFLQNPGGGAIAFMGNSRTGWGGPLEDPDYYTCRQDRYFYRNLFDDGFERLGENFSDLKNDEYDPVDPYNLHKYCFTQLHLLGEPELSIWTDTPADLDVTHPDTLPGGTSSFAVHVEEVGGGDIQDACVCLWKGEEVYLRGCTDSNGDAEFDPSPSTLGIMYVTVSKHNYIPYEGQASVTSTFVRGDANGDGVINVADVVYLVNFLYRSGHPPTPVDAGDANSDDIVNVADVVYLVNYLYRGGDPPLH